MALKLDDETWCYDEERLNYEEISFYYRLYTDHSIRMGRYLIRNMFPLVVSELLEALDCLVTIQKAHDALFGMVPLKALGINVLHAQFY